MPNPAASPLAEYAGETDYSHLLRQERHAHIALRESGRDFDVITDVDLSKDPWLLFGHEVLIIAGHSEYWTQEMYQAVEAFLVTGKKVLALTANAIWWRVSFTAGFEMMECRKIEWNRRGGRAPEQKFGEAWHSTDGKRGGLMRECGWTGLHLIGVEFLGHFGDVPGDNRIAHYNVTAPGDPLFSMPNNVNLQGSNFHTPLVGHEFDITFANMQARMMAHYQALFPNQGYFEPAAPDLRGPNPAEYSSGMVQLGRADFATNFALDYLARALPAEHATHPEAELIKWVRPEGGTVVATSTIDSSRAFHEDESFNAFIRNVLASFGV